MHNQVSRKFSKKYFAMRAKVISTEDEDMIATKRNRNMQTNTFQLCICCACKSFLSNDYIDSSIVFDFSLCSEFAAHSKQDFLANYFLYFGDNYDFYSVLKRPQMASNDQK